MINSQSPNPKFLGGGDIGSLVNVETKAEIGVHCRAILLQPAAHNLNHRWVAINELDLIIAVMPLLYLRPFGPI